jgi:hypothetical protein
MEPLNRLRVVHRNLRAATVIVAVTTLAACGGSGSPLGAGKACTGIGVPVGVSLDVDPAYAPKVGAAAMKICWDGTCKNSDVMLSPSTSSSALPCTATSPDTACGAQSVPTGGKNGFASVMDLPGKAVDATLTLTDPAGAPLIEQTLRITPKALYPNGPDCGSGGPQTGLLVSPNGTVSER